MGKVIFEGQKLRDLLLGGAFCVAKDHGCYIMRAGDKSTLLYGNNCNPDMNDDWWDFVTDECGGDDFVEDLDFSHIPTEKLQRATRLIINFDEDTMETILEIGVSIN